MVLWIASRVLQFGIYFGGGWALTSLTGQVFLTDSAGTSLGYAIVLVIPASWMMSVLAWATFEALFRHETRTVGMKRTTMLVVIGASALEGLSYVLIYLLLLPNTVPVVLTAVIVSVGGTSLMLWAFGYLHRARPPTLSQ